jgi:hypothetical protein
MKIVPFNNHGIHFLRIRTCLFKVHSVSAFIIIIIINVVVDSDSDSDDDVMIMMMM